MQPFSRHAGFFASLKQVEDRLAAEQPQRQPDPPPPPFSDTMTASPLFLGTSTSTATDRGSGPALDFLTLSKDDEDRAQEPQEDSNNDEDDSGEDITRLMSLLGLSPPPRGGGAGDDASASGGCDCSGGDGFMAKVVGMVGPKCEREKKRVDGWIRHYCPGDGGGCREPARLAHLLLAKASWTWDGEGPADRAALAFPSAVKEFLARDAPPPPLTKEGEQTDAE
ncbi:uncharacterized protein LOC100826430 [Brachypodium distachyon]|uniref:Uncharacterized protein n=1 Tax=Brachypodium distachyon TaxID=15368 RepID=I1HDU2_BRADI|nr:uncharacterized protein LOC100826430 [Brachypodium distachyon]KQK03559.1 hypothetical protein BRADI_2g08570v3 [Brachypodium distachyon]|eukprot:XP_003565569.1 uncharacterized protein LOC100826430 [Brachypodium distachyon]